MQSSTHQIATDPGHPRSEPSPVIRATAPLGYDRAKFQFAEVSAHLYPSAGDHCARGESNSNNVCDIYAAAAAADIVAGGWLSITGVHVGRSATLARSRTKSVYVQARRANYISIQRSPTNCINSSRRWRRRRRRLYRVYYIAENSTLRRLGC